MNEQLVNAFAALNIIVSGDDVDSWLAEDSPGYKHLDVNGIVDMMNSEDPDDIDEEEEITEDDISQPCPVSPKEAMAMFEKCLIWLRHQPEATVGNTSTLVTLRELAAEKREATRKQSDIRSFFLLIMIYLKRSHFDILLFLIVFYEGDGDVRVGV